MISPGESGGVVGGVGCCPIPLCLLAPNSMCVRCGAIESSAVFYSKKSVLFCQQKLFGVLSRPDDPEQPVGRFPVLIVYRWWH